MPSVNAITRIEEGVPTPTDFLLEGFPGDPATPLVEGVPSAPQTTLLKVVDLVKRKISNSGVLPVIPSSRDAPSSSRSNLRSSSFLSSSTSASLTSPTSSGSSLPSSSPQSSVLSSSPSPASSGSSTSTASAVSSTSNASASSLTSNASASSSTSTTSLSAVSVTQTFPSITFTTTISDTQTFLSVTPGSPTSATKSTLHNKNTIIGGVVGGVVSFLIVTVLITYYLIRRSRRGKKRDLAHVAAFEVSSDKSIEPTSQPKLQVGPHPSGPNPEVSTANLPSASDPNVAYPISNDIPQEIDEIMDQSSPDTMMPQRDSLVESMSHSNQSSPERIKTTLPIISHNQNPSNLNPLLRDILNATQGRNQGSSDPGDPNVPQNIQIIIINQPSNTNGAVTNEDGENRGDYYGRYLPRNMDVDTSSLPPSYE